jgi:hypothetical protein
VIAATAAHKVDILVDVDNSASMVDKQTYFAQALGDLVDRLVNPRCVDATTGAALGPSTAGACASGVPEFAPVTDMHLGMVTSSLGSRLGDLCDPAATAAPPFTNLSAHNDDRGELVARSLTFASATAATEAPVGDAIIASLGTGFLDWAPGVTGGQPVPLSNASTLKSDVSAMVGGAGYFGCGIESPLESWYRFLIQPDPYASLKSQLPTTQMWQGVDTTILQERKDFLRPDSLVAIIVLSDENDSEIDVRSLGGQGYYFMSQSFAPPKSTHACATNPADSNCESCSVNQSDPACIPTGSSGIPYATYSAPNDWGYDPNLRHVHMKAKYGVDAQYPIARYAIGLTSPTIPDRFGEYADQSGNAVTNYLGRNDCTNPLFANALPDGTDLSTGALCNLPAGTRTPSMVFYTVIGGVPSQLLHYDPSSAASSLLSDADWVRILGVGPSRQGLSTGPSYDYSGIDPHMIEDYRDRTAVSYPFSTDSSATNALVPSSAATASDPVSGREWVTDQESVAGTHVDRVDLQYACTFPLATPRDCTRPENGTACDCPAAQGLTPAQTPPVCDPSNITQQVAAKAYPTPRQLQVARLLGKQAVVGSLCPIHAVDQASGSDPLFGYRPAMNQLVDRLRNGLRPGCLPEALPASAGGVDCRILVALPAGSGGSCAQPSCDPTRGLVVPDAPTLSKMCSEDQIATSVCALQQLTPQSSPSSFDASGSCASSSAPGWCYVNGTTAAGCAQSILFANGSLPPGSIAYLVCP